MVIGSDPHDPSHEVRRVVERLGTVAHRLDDDTVAQVEEFLQWAADTAADGAGRARRPVPRLRPHGLPDQVAVLAGDVLTEAPGRAPELAERLRRLRGRL